MTKKKKPTPFSEWGVKPDKEGCSVTKTNNERQRDFIAAQKAAGLVLVREWVPKGCEFTLKELARTLRSKLVAPTSTDRSAPSPKPRGTSGSPKA